MTHAVDPAVASSSQSAVASAWAAAALVGLHSDSCLCVGWICKLAPLFVGLVCAFLCLVLCCVQYSILMGCCLPGYVLLLEEARELVIGSVAMAASGRTM